MPDWPAPANVQAFTTTRRGPTGASFDLADGNPRLEEARSLLRAWLPAEPVWLRQVHGTDVHVLSTASRASRERPHADAAVALAPGVVCAVRSADCVPILVCDREGTAVAAAHAGWRGLAAGIVEATLAALPVEHGRLMAWLGPAIGPAHFEVGADVLNAFGGANGPCARAFVGKAPGKWRADLYQLARFRLLAADVSAIHGGNACTYDDATRFFSHRRAGERGRMATVIWLAP